MQTRASQPASAGKSHALVPQGGESANGAPVKDCFPGGSIAFYGSGINQVTGLPTRARRRLRKHGVGVLVCAVLLTGLFGVQRTAAQTTYNDDGTKLIWSTTMTVGTTTSTVKRGLSGTRRL